MILKGLFILIVLFIIVPLGNWVLHKEAGIVILPFETIGFEDDNLTGKAIADMLRCDLGEIKSINERSIPEARSPNTKKPSKYWDLLSHSTSQKNDPLDESSEYGYFLSRPMSQKNDPLDYTISQMDIDVQGSSLPFGDMLLTLKELHGKRGITISGSIQEYDHMLSILATLEDRSASEGGIMAWEVNATVDNNQSLYEQIRPLITELAYRIALDKEKQNPKSGYPKTYQAFENLTQARIDYIEYTSTGNVADLDRAMSEAFLARQYEPGYKGKTDLFCDLGYAYLNINNMATAEKIFKEVKNLNSTDSACGLGKVYASNMSDGKALTKFYEATKISPDSYLAWYNLGWALAKSGKYSESLQAYNKSIKINESFAPAWNSKGWAMYKLEDKGKKIENKDKYKEALKCLEEAIRLDRDYASAWNNKGIVLHAMERDNEAIKAYDTAIIIDPKSKYPWNNEANILVEQGNFDEALYAYNISIELDSNYSIPWCGKGEIFYEKLKNYDEALKAYNKSIELDPTYSRPWRSIGNIFYYVKKDYISALNAYNRSAELDPSNEYAWNARGNAFNKLKNYDEALKAYNKSIKLDSTYSSPWCGKGNIFYYIKKNNSAALEAYNKSIELDPSNEYAWIGKGEVFWTKGKYAEAVDVYKKLSELNKSNKLYKYRLNASINKSTMQSTHSANITSISLSKIQMATQQFSNFFKNFRIRSPIYFSDPENHPE